MGTKKALLVGINYRGASGINELNGCCNDARRLSNVLMNFYGFEGTDIDILVDEPADEERDLPTHANIHKYLNKLIDGAQSGDTLVFSFSGHGGRVKIGSLGEDHSHDTNSDNTGYNEMICPYDHTNVLTDDDFREIVSGIPAGVNFTVISDSCNSGGLIDELVEQIGGAELKYEEELRVSEGSGGSKRLTEDMLISSLNNDDRISDPVDDSNIGRVLYDLYKDDSSLTFKCRFNQDAYSRAGSKSDDVGILLSACESWEFSTDTADGGVFTVALESVLEELRSAGESSPTYRQLIMAVRGKIEEVSESQHPCLYCSDTNADALFVGEFV
ncbi:hypothetical protein M758_1G064400 [Ceratodon purpureus]|nr:hypothetical protein M758_1G064400 [Ceratodon purpureus]